MSLLDTMKAKDLVALVVIVGFLVLRLNGVDGDIETVVALVLGYYFVKRQNGADNGH